MKIFIVLLISVIAVSFASIFIKLCPEVPSITISFYRMAVSAIIISFFALKNLKEIKNYSKKLFLLNILSGFALALHFILWISSLKYTSVASSVALVTTDPIFVGIFSYLILREKVSKNLIIGIILSVSGSFILAFGDKPTIELIKEGKNPLFGDILALSGAIMASLYILLGSRVRKEASLITYNFITFNSSFLFLLVIVFITKNPLTGFNKISYLYLLLLGIVPQLIGHSGFNWALKYVKPVIVAITILGEPIGATILAFLIFKEGLKISQIFGMFLIFIAIIISSLPKK